MRKEKIQQVIATLPEEVDVDALMEKLYLLHRIEIAEEQLAKGHEVSQEDAERRLAKWLE